MGDVPHSAEPRRGAASSGEVSAHDSHFGAALGAVMGVVVFGFVSVSVFAILKCRTGGRARRRGMKTKTDEKAQTDDVAVDLSQKKNYGTMVLATGVDPEAPA